MSLNSRPQSCQANTQSATSNCLVIVKGVEGSALQSMSNLEKVKGLVLHYTNKAHLPPLTIVEPCACFPLLCECEQP